MFIYCFTFGPKFFHIYWKSPITITGEGLQNLGLCSAIKAFVQGEIFIMPHLKHGASVFLVSSEGPPHLVIATYNTQGDVEDLF
jgi:hypothetical protein